MRTVSRVPITTLIILCCITGTSCAEPRGEQSPAARLVQRELRREFSTRFLNVSERAPDSLFIALSGGRLTRGAGVPTVSADDRATLARRAVELLSPGTVMHQGGVRIVVVDVSQGRRLGPLVFGGRRARSVHDVAALVESGAADRAPSKSLLKLAAPSDTAP